MDVARCRGRGAQGAARIKEAGQSFPSRYPASAARKNGRKSREVGRIFSPRWWAVHTLQRVRQMYSWPVPRAEAPAATDRFGARNNSMEPHDYRILSYFPGGFIPPPLPPGVSLYPRSRDGFPINNTENISRCYTRESCVPRKYMCVYTVARKRVARVRVQDAVVETRIPGVIFRSASSSFAFVTLSLPDTLSVRLHRFPSSFAKERKFRGTRDQFIRAHVILSASTSYHYFFLPRILCQPLNLVLFLVPSHSSSPRARLGRVLVPLLRAVYALRSRRAEEHRSLEVARG